MRLQACRGQLGSVSCAPQAGSCGLLLQWQQQAAPSFQHQQGTVDVSSSHHSTTCVESCTQRRQQPIAPVSGNLGSTASSSVLTPKAAASASAVVDQQHGTHFPVPGQTYQSAVDGDRVWCHSPCSCAAFRQLDCLSAAPAWGSSQQHAQHLPCQLRARVIGPA